jgi:hypothetical protein
MSLYESDPRVRPASIGAYPRRRRPVARTYRAGRLDEPSYSDFFVTQGVAAVAVAAGF